MDIKLKKSKMIIGMVSWFAGLIILAVNLAGLALEASVYPDFGRQIKEVMDGNYQNTEEFRYRVSDIVNHFLSIAAAEDIAYDREEEHTGAEVNAETVILLEEAVTAAVEESGYGLEEYYGEYYGMTKQDADWYHESIKNDRNILYTVANKGEILYTNEENLELYGNDFVMPDGYNFMLYFDGEKALVIQNGKEINIYGDGYYGTHQGDYEESGWNIPGYKNFPADETVKDVRICIVAAQTPYIMSASHDNNYYGSGFYNIQESLYGRREAYTKWIQTTLAGVILFVIGLFLRKYRKEAAGVIAAITGKWWYEIKLLPVLVTISYFMMAGIIVISTLYWNGGHLFERLREYAYSDSYREYEVGIFLFTILIIMSGILWVFINDARYNKKPWKNSLTAKIIRQFHISDLKLPFSRHMVRYQKRIFIAGIICSILVIASGILYYEGFFSSLFDRESQVFIMAAVLISVIFIFCQIIFAKKVRVMVQDVDILAEQIKTVHDGEIITEQTKAAGISEKSGLAEISEDLNEIKAGMNKAINEQMKSERMKVELIANVSHDIKTPLTSIISYVELLKQEQDLPEHVKEYISILENKSQRLKTMVQDVFEVSKAASGELPVEMKNLDLGKLLRQTIADMGEQIAGSTVSVKPEIPEEAVMIYADGNRLYRVFQNLIQNALKYSLDGSRVYITLKRNGSFAVASVKNTSRDELQEEIDFTERFTRGDSSRSDGGSGLGLSIAQSFTEACGGNFKVEIIADLFVVTVSFPII